mmetsp:Transcript_20459/g.32996  ORF Transcript_20459/g.32996 Transcript_20459/m.32996 type:complete len:166 (-) Transcript_20459:195-692(-)
MPNVNENTFLRRVFCKFKVDTIVKCYCCGFIHKARDIDSSQLSCIKKGKALNLSPIRWAPNHTFWEFRIQALLCLLLQENHQRCCNLRWSYNRVFPEVFHLQAQSTILRFLHSLLHKRFLFLHVWIVKFFPDKALETCAGILGVAECLSGRLLIEEAVLLRECND